MQGAGCGEGALAARICAPSAKLAALSWFVDMTRDHHLGTVSTGVLYRGMAWLGARQCTIKEALARKYLRPEANPERPALSNLSSS